MPTAAVATAIVAVFAVAASAAQSPPQRRPADPTPARQQAQRPSKTARRQADLNRRATMMRGACSARWYDDLASGNDVDCYGQLTGSGDGKVRCRGRCGMLVPPQDVAACVVTEDGRPLSPRDAERWGVAGRPVPVCTDCRTKAPPDRTPKAKPLVMVQVLGLDGVERVALERMSGWVPTGPAVTLEKVGHGPSHTYEAMFEATAEEPGPGEHGYDGSTIAEAMAGLKVRRLKLTQPPVPTGGSPKPQLEITPGMTAADRARATADYQEQMDAYLSEERTLSAAIEAIRAASPDGSRPRLVLTDDMTDVERAAATAAHAKQLGAYNAAMFAYCEMTGVNQSQSEQGWRRSRAVAGEGPCYSNNKGRMREPA